MEIRFSGLLAESNKTVTMHRIICRCWAVRYAAQGDEQHRRSQKFFCEPNVTRSPTIVNLRLIPRMQSILNFLNPAPPETHPNVVGQEVGRNARSDLVATVYPEMAKGSPRAFEGHPCRLFRFL
jgi:hypothetical protein